LVIIQGVASSEQIKQLGVVGSTDVGAADVGEGVGGGVEQPS